MDMDILWSWQSKYGKYFEQDETKHPFCVKHVPRLNEQSFRYLKILCIEDGWKFEISMNDGIVAVLLLNQILKNVPYELCGKERCWYGGVFPKKGVILQENTKQNYV